MSTAPAAFIGLCVLGAAGLLPALATAGRRWIVLPLAPLTGSVLASIAAAGCLALGGEMLAWFLSVAVVCGAVASHWLVRRSGARWSWSVRPNSELPDDSTPIYRRAGTAGAVVILLAVVGSLVAVRAPSIGFDARTIWLLHAVWFTGGHRVALHALTNPAMPFAHSSYPPLVGASVAVTWLVTASRSYYLGVVIIALLNGCAVGVAAWTAVEVGRRCGQRVAIAHRHAMSDVDRPSRIEAPYVAGVVVAALLVFAAFGVAGPFATNGYADLLWSAGAVGAIGFALVLPLNRHDLFVAAILVLVAGLSKQEGTATAMVIVVLIAVRLALLERSRGRRFPRRSLLAGVLGVLALGAWPVLMLLLGAAPNVAVPGPRVGDLASRTHAVVVAMSGHLHVVALAIPVALLGALALRRVRRKVEIANDLWAWTALAAGTILVAGIYVTGSGNIGFWLATSVHRTTFFPALCAWWIVGIWAVLGTAQGAVPLTTAVVPAGTPETEPLDEGRPVVLHHQA